MTWIEQRFIKMVPDWKHPDPPEQLAVQSQSLYSQPPHQPQNAAGRKGERKQQQVGDPGKDSYHAGEGIASCSSKETPAFDLAVPIPRAIRNNGARISPPEISMNINSVL